MKRIIFTPAGREKSMSLLARHLAAQKNDFDSWFVALNTTDPSDLEFCRSLAKKYSWIKTIEPFYPPNWWMSVYQFYTVMVESKSLYLKIDDDFVWIEKGAVAKVFEQTELRKSNFAVLPTMVNSSLCSHMHQRMELIPSTEGYCEWNCHDPVGFSSPKFGELVHRSFLDSLQKGEADKWHLPNMKLWHYERILIGVMGWRGADMGRFNGVVPVQDETFLSMDKPRELQMPNVIFGNAIFCHYASGPQRVYLDKTDILSQYAKYAP